MSTGIDHILSAAASQPWALMPEKLAEIQAFLALRADGARFSREEIQARIGPGRTGEPAASSGVVAVIPIVGIISQRMNMMADISGPGGTSTDRVGAAFRRAMADPNVKAIVFDVDSPGGSTYGTQELADEIFAARGRKPIVAQVNSLAASAAYWIISSASEIVATPGGDVGSIGVYGMHSDVSAAMEKAGIRKTFISAGEFKTEGNPFEPLGEEARAYAQKRVNETYGDFVRAVARGRGVTPARVRAEYGKGRAVGAREAARLGMVDRIATMQETLRRLGGGGPVAAPASPGGMDAASMEMRRRRHAQRVRVG
ncbi:S49 family peptidase [Methylobacterium ajmalii]|jgi:signal peptide peptidase SppA|uniref:S49 family peptidase n=1 Tax=Methylobacterium ajmalii TaxID=2738439 RepID=UPI00190CB7C7|nr:S49 family peptidase [Methylobacterium ajmalii]MBK3398911.1 S49 family peptidase [Methylobacterium ajmalii]MBK3409568.1 S49 family peptidase [Methylobacterium ajmalii]MBK3425675.1 S49 family peptidase [Methylobacterium ajmalii]